MRVCACGNDLGKLDFLMVVSPCRCSSPGDQAKMLPTPGTLPSFMHDSAVIERRRAGLKDCTDYERGVAARWV